jgi:hypothetical protein
VDTLLKTCTKCKEAKDVSVFGKRHVSAGGGTYAECLKCRSARALASYHKNKEAYHARINARRKGVRRSEKEIAGNKAWVEANRDRCREAAAQWKKRNRGAVRAAVTARLAHVKKATPPWVDLSDIKFVYEIAAMFGQSVDHIYPLRGKNSSGLHVPWNLQLMPKDENSRKRNLSPEEYDAR